jgi:hypothetical protein
LPLHSVTGTTSAQTSVCDNDGLRNRSPPSRPRPSLCFLARGTSILICNKNGTVSTSRFFPGYLLVLLSLGYVISVGASTKMRDMPSQRNIVEPAQSSKLGLNLAGRLKCYLWGQLPSRGPRAARSLTPLFQPNRDTLEEQESKTEETLRVVYPSSVYATADYHFQRERFYGVKNVGLLFRWFLRSGDRGNGNTTQNGVGVLPSNFDIAFDHAIPPIALSNPTDSVNMRFSWDRNMEDDTVLDLAPWIKIGVHLAQHKPGGSLGFFLPLSDRLNVQWTSHWDMWNRAARSFTARPVERSRRSDPDWWIPDIRLDPFGILSSESRFSSHWREHYSLDVKLKVITTTPSLLLGNMVDEEYPTATLRLDCSICDERLDRPSVTTARFETFMISSSWWQSIRGTSRVTILREKHNNVITDG